ncbi:hypothetical protein [Stutzerimonas stutzeri]|uniref:hypothetical protein n=1 Tax=Stutzerimonas stutzeri TaxID=316 RepID=UPI00210C9380|nr:hypothetical protein [Stutzerimonas stutzeri]MCQ4257470.1 hypothetical protein [Stutzerimonas stutzeri]
MSKPSIIKFKKSWQGYGPNEVAGFPKEKADKLIEGGVAESFTKGKATTTPPSSGAKTGAATTENTAASTSQTPADDEAVDEDKKP